jgi:hypothetical protein
MFLMEAFPLLGLSVSFHPFAPPPFLPFISVVFPLAFLQVFNSDVSWLSSFLFQVLNLVSILPFPSCVVGANKVHDLANPSSTFIVGVGPFLSKTSAIFVMGPYPMGQSNGHLTT